MPTLQKYAHIDQFAGERMLYRSGFCLLVVGRFPTIRGIIKRAQKLACSDGMWTRELVFPDGKKCKVTRFEEFDDDQRPLAGDELKEAISPIVLNDEDCAEAWTLTFPLKLDQWIEEDLGESLEYRRVKNDHVYIPVDGGCVVGERQALLIFNFDQFNQLAILQKSKSFQQLLAEILGNVDPHSAAFIVGNFDEETAYSPLAAKNPLPAQYMQILEELYEEPVDELAKALVGFRKGKAPTKTQEAKKEGEEARLRCRQILTDGKIGLLTKSYQGRAEMMLAFVVQGAWEYCQRFLDGMATVSEQCLAESSKIAEVSERYHDVNDGKIHEPLGVEPPDARNGINWNDWILKLGGDPETLLFCVFQELPMFARVGIEQFQSQFLSELVVAIQCVRKVLGDTAAANFAAHVLPQQFVLKESERVVASALSECLTQTLSEIELEGDAKQVIERWIEL